MEKLFGAFLISVGVLVATLCGLCSFAYLGVFLLSFVNPGPNPGQTVMTGLSLLPVVLIFGGLPTGVGVALVFAGLSLRRHR